MENLNAEQVKRGLECFHLRILNTNVAEKITESEIMAIINALALIKAQDQMLEAYRQELAEVRVALAEARKDADDLKAIAEGYQKQFEDCAEDRSRLTEENERLIDTAYRLESEVHRERADTVRKFAKRVKEGLNIDSEFKSFYGEETIFKIVDQVAKELTDASE